MSARHALMALLATACLYGAGAAVAAGDAARGEKLFQDCRACHSIDKGAPNAMGPSLHGVFGRKAGALEEFRYSPALKRSNITWSAELLDSYLADPQKMVPGNRMPYAGMPDERDRADLIMYMQQVFIK
jgi:cytochrome c